MNKPPFPTSTCSPREAARQLGVSVRTAQLWVEEGRLQAWKTPGGHRRILLDSVARLRDEQLRVGRGLEQPCHVMILHEDPHQGSALKDGVQPLLPDCSVWVVEDGYEGLIQIGERRPEVLITHLMVSGLDMFHMVRALLAHARDRAMLIVVLVDTDAGRSEIRACLPDEAVIVRTPVDGGELAALVRAFLRNWRKRSTFSGGLEEGR
ncbi:excisionase family DNA-binding protein [Zoogloea sp.]|uniref:excisionase family DNA-binding protein n=1 Tax=Zoogloea sp. TaxID=49181 RepID=UPI0014157F56|nr:MAG: helix-turn-helix domain-containing protein [Zoogloea sp.]